MQPAGSFDAKGFLRSLYDFGFESLVTTRIIRFLYGLLVVVYSIAAVILFFAGLLSGTAGGILLAIFAIPIGYLLYVIAARVWMEFLIVVFRMGDDIRAMRMAGGPGSGPQPPTPGRPPS